MKRAFKSLGVALVTKALRNGIRPDGRVLSAVMPWPYTRLITDEEMRALWLYIHSVPRKTQEVTSRRHLPEW